VSRDDQVAYRFVVWAGDGRRSARWRVWTGSQNNAPSDEVYIAPRSLGSEVKVSLHSDGTCLYRLTKEANPRAIGSVTATHCTVGRSWTASYRGLRCGGGCGCVFPRMS